MGLNILCKSSYTYKLSYSSLLPPLKYSVAGKRLRYNWTIYLHIIIPEVADRQGCMIIWCKHTESMISDSTWHKSALWFSWALCGACCRLDANCPVRWCSVQQRNSKLPRYPEHHPTFTLLMSTKVQYKSIRFIHTCMIKHSKKNLKYWANCACLATVCSAPLARSSPVLM